ncbi:Permease of the drug/metabolite transporter (DMT) superfamily [Tranquillimonas rosea]|uniref:Permease of the drug/metabolite transporter (DMT) superfamily n=1 Tax=Tranquillimonas rosea TaxID=641238 RepID=A0A1H9P624_9RHOB|nr:DMT family transporter [Tranquillimonas rosea]SER43541.1 Permease of the drug/metabolite transporter (DMT) superfamily [Tranquillimonas rosea]
MTELKRMVPADANPLEAAAWMAGAIVSFSAMAVAGREVSLELDTFEIMTYRSLVGVVLVLIGASALGTLREVSTRRFGLHVVRNVFHFTGQNLWFFAIATAPLAQVFALEFSAPIWVALAAPFVLSERLTRTRLIAALVGFAGILIVARPDMSGLAPGLLPAALAAFGFAGSILTTKILTRTATITCILFWLTSMQAVFGLVCAGLDGSIALPSAGNLPWIGVIGLAGLMAHLCLTTALSVAPATLVVPFDFLRLPVIAAVGMLMYAEPVALSVAVGAALICGANYLNVYAERRRRTGLVAQR